MNRGIGKAAHNRGVLTPKIHDWKTVQFSFEKKAKRASHDELTNLIKQIMKSVVATWGSGTGDYIGNTMKVILDWTPRCLMGLDSEDSAFVKKYLGENWLIEVLLSDPRTKYIYRFTKNRLLHLWVVVEEPNATVEYEYSDYFSEALKRFDEFYCDFMVFSEDQICSLVLPPDTTKLEGRSQNA
ncbi:MAG: hypothetical protein AB1426_01985 [Bacillota bacterium]